MCDVRRDGPVVRSQGGHLLDCCACSVVSPFGGASPRPRVVSICIESWLNFQFNLELSLCQSLRRIESNSENGLLTVQCGYCRFDVSSSAPSTRGTAASLLKCVRDRRSLQACRAGTACCWCDNHGGEQVLLKEYFERTGINCTRRSTNTAARSDGSKKPNPNLPYPNVSSVSVQVIE